MARVVDVGLLDREGELEETRRLAESAAAGEGGLVLVEAPAGVGKTSVLREAVAVARALGFETATARGSELEGDFAFGLVRQLFEPKLAGLDVAGRAELFAGAAGLAAPLFEPLDADVLSPRGEASHAALHGLYWLTVNLASRRPLALAVDDLHWGDAPSLRFLAYLVNRVDELPVLMVGATRPSEPGPDLELLDRLATSPSTRLLRPKPLTRASVAELVRSALGDPDPEFADACHDATRGNPLLLGELLTTLTREGVEPRADRAESVLELASRSVGRSVGLRMRGLGSEAGELARAVAVLGEGSELERAAALAELDLARAAAVAEDLARADILRPEGVEFVHPVVRAAIYSRLSSSERARWHRRAAAMLADAGADEDEVALHLIATRPSDDPGVVEALRRAGRRAHSRGAPDVAASYLERALSEPPPRAQRAELLVELGLAELAVNDTSGIARMHEALELPDDPRAHARLALQVGRSLFLWVDYAGAARVLEDALGKLPEPERELRDQLEAQLISACFIDPTLRPRVAARTLALLEDSSGVTDPVLLATLSTLAIVAREPAAVGVALAERALGDGRLSLEEEPTVITMAAVALMAGDQLERAQRVWDRALAEALSHGALYAAGFAITLRALARVRLGAVAAAEADAAAALQKLPGESPVQQRWILSSFTDALVERGELDEPSDLLHELGDLRRLPDAPESCFLLDSAGRLRVAQGRVEEGIALLRECGRRLEAWGVRNPGFVPWRADLAAALAGAGERGEALEIANTGIELARVFEVPRELGMALRAAGLAQGGEASIELMSEAVRVLGATPAQLEHARALTDLGAALRRAGKRSDARSPLREGLNLAQRCNALALVERAHEELRATGARPRRLVLSGVDSLTASERRTAEMASEGLTNREIAQALFVTEKTVETHLRHAYRKLDIKSRSELPRALVGRSQPATP